MTRFTDTVATTLPKGAGESVRAVAAAQHATVAHYLRTAIMDRLKADGATLDQRTEETA